MTIQEILQEIRTLTVEERKTLMLALVDSFVEASEPKKHSILELDGLGAEIWQGIDAQEYVNKRVRIMQLAALAVLVLVGTLTIWMSVPSEPTYGGKKLSEWVQNYNARASLEKRKRTDQAIRQMGGPAAKWLAKELQIKEPRFKLWLIRLFEKQSLIRFNIARVNVDERRWQAAYGLLALGPSAAPALPETCVVPRVRSVGHLVQGRGQPLELTTAPDRAHPGEIECRQIATLLADYLAGTLPRRTAELLEWHIDGCGPCVAFVNTYRGTIRATRAVLGEVEIPAELKKRLLAVLRAQRQPD